MSINKILIQLANEPKTNAKIQILKDNSDNKLLKNVFQKALDPTINFYIKKIPQYDYVESTVTLEDALPSLNVLSSRKMTGNKAIDFLSGLLSSLSPDDASVIEKVILRDMRCGVSESTVNKIWKGLIPEYPYMRCSLLHSTNIKEYSWDDGVFSQLKADGRFNNLNKTPEGDIELLSRAGQILPNEKFENIVNAAKSYFDNDTQTHGEFLVKRNGEILDREISNGILNSISRGGEFAENDEPIYLVWDQIPLSQLYPGCTINIPYKERFEKLSNQCESIDNGCIEMIETRIIHNVDDAIDHFESVLELGLEGTVIKNPDMLWKDTTSKHQVKLKLEIDTIDLMVVGFNEGKGRNSDTFGSIKLRSGDDLLEVNISGFKDKERKEIHEIRESLINTVVTIKSNKLMVPKIEGKLHSLFLPRFKTLRNDKTVADTLPEIEAKFESAINDIRKYF